MIKIEIRYNSNSKQKKKLKTLLVKGHSIKNNNMIEPACACVSNIILGLVNYFQSHKINQKPQIVVKPGYVNFDFSADIPTLQVVNLTIIQLRMTANYFKSKISLCIFK